jgi:glycosyltransferase involved in cell wall biosynthesis
MWEAVGPNIIHEFVTVIVPIRDEKRHIAMTLESIVSQDYPRDRMEVLVVDGMSTDGTREIVAGYCRRHPFIRLLDNPRKITPAALNIGIAHARGDIIMRMDSHSHFPSNYISSLVDWQDRTGADNVGGVCRTLPGNDTHMAKAIAVALSHPFGVGNSYFRIGTAKPRWVDTVPFGSYRREVFARIGYFDESLVRNQDDEFNLRLRKSGGRLLLIPTVIIQYYTRDSLSKLWRMYYQYGYFKPLVARKSGSILSPRQFVPSLSLLALFMIGILGQWIPQLGALGILGLLAYFVLCAGVSLAAVRLNGITVASRLIMVFPTLHCSYGLGFLKGFLDFFLLGKMGVQDEQGLPLSR